MTGRERIKFIIASHIRDWDRAIPLFESGKMRMRHGTVDVTKEHVEALKKQRQEQAQLLAELDHEDGTDSLALTPDR